MEGLYINFIISVLLIINYQINSLVINFLVENKFTVNLIGGWGNDRDEELARCKFILNIHGNLSDGTPSKIFEHIRCDRLLDSGFSILSEDCVKLDSKFINKYTNLRILKYNDFFNIMNILNVYNRTPTLAKPPNYKNRIKNFGVCKTTMPVFKGMVNLTVGEIPKIGIFNGMFPSQHHELYGFIINYAKNKGYEVDIYYPENDDLGWLDFYKNKFKNVNTIHFMLFTWGKLKSYKYFFMPTDDDRPFSKDINNPTHWPKNVICINHTNKIRTPGYKHYLNCANFKGSNLEYTYPCYNNMNVDDKMQKTKKIVCIIGDRIYWKNNNIINRLYSKNKINLLIMGRKGESTMKDSKFSDKFEVSYYENIDTTEMMNHLRNSSFVLMNYDKHDDHNTGETCSGSLQLALSNLCMPIMAKQANKYLKIKNALEFDLDDNEPIGLDEIENINFKAIEKERDYYINKFENYLDNLNSNSNIKTSLTTNKDIVDTKKNIDPKKNIALMMYGQFRSYKNNLQHNLKMLYPILKDYNVNVFILTEKSGNYSLDNEKEIINVFKQWNFNVCFIKYVEDIDDDEEEKYYWNFIKNKKNNKGYANDFVPRLQYRRNYLVNNLVNEYTIKHNLNIDLAIYARIFDIKFSHVKPIDKILNINTDFKDVVYCCPDMIFIGKFNNILDTLKLDVIYDDAIWDDKNFNTFCKKYETVLVDEKHTYCSEIQLLSTMYNNPFTYITIASKENNKLYDENTLFNINFDSSRYDYVKKFSGNNNLNNTFKMIPKKIFQTWESDDIDPEFQTIVDSWKMKNPNYEYKFYNARDRRKFIKEHFDKIVIMAYDKILPGAFKCDLWRLCVLYIEGGVYIDFDTLCMGKLDDFIDVNDEFVVPIDLNINPAEGQHNLFNSFMASIPQSPILLEAINQIVYNVENNIIPNSLLDFSGPGMLGRSVNKYMKRSEADSFIGMEGPYRWNCLWITFLKFEKDTEYVKNVNGDILFQNKNGNQKIIDLYQNEIRKLENYTAWTSTDKMYAE